jgi:hypothetical protein
MVLIPKTNFLYYDLLSKEQVFKLKELFLIFINYAPPMRINEISRNDCDLNKNCNYKEQRAREQKNRDKKTFQNLNHIIFIKNRIFLIIFGFNCYT